MNTNRHYIKPHITVKKKQVIHLFKASETLNQDDLSVFFSCNCAPDARCRCSAGCDDTC